MSDRSGDGATVLIVDDEKHTRDGLRMSLEDDFVLLLVEPVAASVVEDRCH